MKKGLLFFLVLCYCSALFSQQDTLVKTSYTPLSQVLNAQHYHHLAEDSTLDNLHNYQRTDFNGNLGLPAGEIILENKATHELGLRYFVPSYRQHFFSRHDLAFYNTKNPYTRAFALVGQRQEQIIRVIHTQNIKRFNYTLKFNRAKCTGFYNSQSAIEDNFAGSINYHNKKDRYRLYSWLLYNKLRHQENGGIYSQQDFEEGFMDNKELLRVNLSGAKRATRTLQAGLMQFLQLNKGTDSSRMHHRLYHSFHYDGDFYLYNDTNVSAAFYSNFIYDTLETYDSAHVSRFKNSAGYQFELNTKNKFIFFSGLSHEFVLIYQRMVDSSLQNLLVTAGLTFSKEKKYSTWLKGELVANGANAGDLQVEGNFFQAFEFLKSKLSIQFHSENRTADFFFRRYYGNNFTWLNDFNKVSETQVNVRYAMFNDRLSVSNLSRLSGEQIYFDTNAMPLQYHGNILSNRIALQGKLKLKRIHFNNTFHYQFSTQENIVRLPAFYVQSQVYYEGRHFKNNLHLQTGLQISWYSTAFNNAYMPATNSYYLQNTQKQGNYPFADIFVSAEIKPVRFFIKYEHINQGLSGAGFMLTPDYPLPDRAFKFGFTWLFWD